MDDLSNIAPGVETSMPEVDYLVCGSCRQEFFLHDIVLFMQHKKVDCDDLQSFKQVQGLPSRLLLCKSCPRKFTTPWQLLQHAQRVHALLIYMEEELGSLRGDTYVRLDQQRGRGSDTISTGMQTETTVTPLTTNIPYSPFKTPPAEKLRPLQANPQFITSLIKKHTITPQTSLLKANETLITVGNPEVRGGNLKHGSRLNRWEVDPSVIERNVDPAVLERNVDPAVIERKVDPAVIERNVDPAVVERNVDPAVVERNRDPTVIERNVDISTDELKAVLCANNDTRPADCELGRSPEAVIGDKAKIETDGVDDINQDGSRIKSENEAEVETKCCDNQACGITLMPLTHDQPKKCCVAVVPKKRKRHMQTKHMAGRRRFSRLRKSSDTNVFIDIDSSMDASPSKQNGGQDGVTSSCGNTGLSSQTISGHIPLSKEKSVIIQPGTTFSIPVPITLSKPVTPAQQYGGQSTGVNICRNAESSGSVYLPLQTASFQISSSGVVTQVRESPGQGQRQLVFDDKKTNVAGSSVELRGMISDGQARGRKRKYPTSRPYKCDKCDQAFNQRIHLRKHQSKHTGVKPFQCQQCDYSTVEKSHLKVHIRLHTGEKPFKCTYCEYATAQNSTLKIHLKRHHMRPSGNSKPQIETSVCPFRHFDKKAECTTCEIVFDNEGLLQLHREEKHRASSSQSAPPSQSNQSDFKDRKQ